jgi:4,5-DOPA dioxygenase extradiol
LIVGSGNMVHNLGQLQWNAAAKPLDWAEAANDKLKTLVNEGNHSDLINYQKLGKEVQMAIPTPEHYLPLLYILGMKGPKEEIGLFNDKMEMGSISMTSVRVG